MRLERLVGKVVTMFCAGVFPMRYILLLSLLVPCTTALDNGLIAPPLGWSSWYGFTSHIDEAMLKEMADGMVNSG